MGGNETAAYWAFAAIAVIVTGLAKGGFSGLGALAMPIMALGVNPVRGAAIMLPILIVQDVVSVWMFRRTWDRKLVLVALPGIVLGVALGWLYALYFSERAVLAVLGVIALVFGAQKLWRMRSGAAEPPVSDAPAWQSVVLPAATGFASQIAHAGGPPFQIWLQTKDLSRDVFVGTNAIAFAAINWIKVPAYMQLGQFTPANLTASALLFPIALASTIAGAFVVRRVSQSNFIVMVNLLLVVVGAKLVWDGFVG
jgi:uncharacterized membrane protein YfcA